MDLCIQVCTDFIKKCVIGATTRTRAYIAQDEYMSVLMRRARASDAPYFESHVSNRRWIEILRTLPDDSPDGIMFTEKEVEAILGGNAARILKLD